MIYERRTDGPNRAGCSVSARPDAIGEQVEHLDKLNFGQTAVVLCEDCLGKLAALLGEVHHSGNSREASMKIVWATSPEGIS